MKRRRFQLLLLLAIFSLGCSGYRVVRVSGWQERSQVANTQYSLRQMNGNDYWTSLLFSPNSPNSALYIPNYAYFQGFAYTPAQMSVIGQVRLIGGMAARHGVALRDGAMVTTNPDAMQDRIQPSRFRYQVINWRELNSR